MTEKGISEEHLRVERRLLRRLSTGVSSEELPKPCVPSRYLTG